MKILTLATLLLCAFAAQATTVSYSLGADDVCFTASPIPPPTCFSAALGARLGDEFDVTTGGVLGTVDLPYNTPTHAPIAITVFSTEPNASPAGTYSRSDSVFIIDPSYQCCFITPTFILDLNDVVANGQHQVSVTGYSGLMPGAFRFSDPSNPRVIGGVLTIIPDLQTFAAIGDGTVTEENLSGTFELTPIFSPEPNTFIPIASGLAIIFTRLRRLQS